MKSESASAYEPAAIAIVADRPLPAADYRARLDQIEPLRHVTVEVHTCPAAPAP